MSGSGRSDLVDIAGIVKNQTEKAVLLDDGARQVWLPKSLIEVESQPRGVSTVTMPEWLARDKGLI